MRCTFIGGPLDGERREVPYPGRDVLVPSINKPRAVVYDDKFVAWPPGPEIKTTQYRYKRTIKGGEEVFAYVGEGEAVV